MPAEAKKGERIAKFMAAAGLCSRREAEVWIAAGRVVVNGETITSPALNVIETDTVLVDGEAVGKQEEIKLYRFYKPVDVLTTTKDPQGRKTVFDVIPPKLGRLVTVGRLDVNSEGLLLLTNNGDLAQKLMKPNKEMPRVYKVRVLGKPTENALARLKKGLTVEGVKYRSILAEVESTKEGAGKNTWLKVTLTEGKNREIRKVFESLGYPVNRLMRLSYGPFELGTLKKGEVVPVPHHQLQKFLQGLG